MAKLETAPNVDAGVISEETKNAMIMKERKANSPWRKFIRNKSAVVGLIIVVFMMGIGLFAPWIAPCDPNATDVTSAYLAPARKATSSARTIWAAICSAASSTALR